MKQTLNLQCSYVSSWFYSYYLTPKVFVLNVSLKLGNNLPNQTFVTFFLVKNAQQSIKMN